MNFFQETGKSKIVFVYKNCIAWKNKDEPPLSRSFIRLKLACIKSNFPTTNALGITSTRWETQVLISHKNPLNPFPFLNLSDILESFKKDKKLISFSGVKAIRIIQGKKNPSLKKKKIARIKQ